MGAVFTGWPDTTLPVFIAMMFGATLGGNSTLIGAAANVVAAGICPSRGASDVHEFLRYGLPLNRLPARRGGAVRAGDVRLDAEERDRLNWAGSSWLAGRLTRVNEVAFRRTRRSFA